MKISATGKRRFNQLICTNLATPSGFSWNNSSRAIQTVRVFFEQTSYSSRLCSSVIGVYWSHFTLTLGNRKSFCVSRRLGSLSVCAESRRNILADLTPSRHKNFITIRCSTAYATLARTQYCQRQICSEEPSRFTPLHFTSPPNIYRDVTLLASPRGL